MSLVLRHTTVKLTVDAHLASEAAIDVAKGKVDTFISNQITAGTITADSDKKWESKTTGNTTAPYYLQVVVNLVLVSASQLLNLRTAVVNVLSEFDSAQSLDFVVRERWDQETVPPPEE